ncbi:unnamed protein product [Acanthoscelides obtectus]|nr:unnamed protein product [Acanthoscelides obtectus]CAK1680623.1 hypothetical protein AOBTE_LOCUS32810 [Acanthoscelides obtectus]
MELNIN